MLGGRRQPGERRKDNHSERYQKSPSVLGVSRPYKPSLRFGSRGELVRFGFLLTAAIFGRHNGFDLVLQ